MMNSKGLHRLLHRYLGDICRSPENDAMFFFKENESEMNIPTHPAGVGGVGEECSEQRWRRERSGESDT